MPENPKVSVILTSYNHANFLREAIDSVLVQTFPDFELLIWDDASTDLSWEIINSYSDSRIRAYRNETNLRSGIINQALAQATGKYVAIHHSDDIWEPEKLEKQAGFLDINPNIGAVFTWTLAIDEHSQPFNDEAHSYYRIFEQPNRTRHEWLNYFFHHGNALCHPSLMIRRQCYSDVGFYRYGLAQLTDFDMWVRLCMMHEIHVMPEKLVRFRVRDSEANTSGNRAENRIRHLFDILQIYKFFLRIQDKQEFLQVFPEASIYIDENLNGDTQYALARLALSPNHTPSSQLFGLQVLFDILQDQKHFAVIQSLYNFSIKDFFALAAQYDVFGSESLRIHSQQLAEREAQLTERDRQLAKRAAQLAERDTQLAERDIQLAEQDKQLAAIHSSKIWRLGLWLRRIRLWVAPPRSIQARMGAWLISMAGKFTNK
jgi:glycosyltransferase involved in cell wall biosynthesis